MEVIYQVGSWTQYQQTKLEFQVKALGMCVFFGSKGGKNYAIIAEYKRRGPSRSGGRWHGRSGVYNVYYRVNFATREAGNAAYRRVKRLFDSCRPWHQGSDIIDCCGSVTYEQLKAALSAGSTAV